MKKINIREKFSSDFITRAAGEKLRLMILEAAEKGEVVEIDFSNLMIASTSFFDEGFAKLADSGWTHEKMNTAIVLKNIHPKDKEILEELFKRREKM